MGEIPSATAVIISQQEPTISFHLGTNLNNVRRPGEEGRAAPEPLKNPGGSQSRRKTKPRNDVTGSATQDHGSAPVPQALAVPPVQRVALERAVVLPGTGTRGAPGTRVPARLEGWLSSRLPWSREPRPQWGKWGCLLPTGEIRLLCLSSLFSLVIAISIGLEGAVKHF